MTKADRLARAERNERRGRVPKTTVPVAVERPRFYRYGNVMVRLWRGRLEVPRLRDRLGRIVPAPATSALQPLPKALRRQIAREAAHAARKARLEATGVEIPDQRLVVPSGAVR